ncbi:MAG: hypothetical protein JXB85_04270 [Anaerolineales bacterium]|nr:hypothetical protein [Anaerolineales bacterium]
MKKTLVITALLAAALLTVGIGSVAAQGEQPPSTGGYLLNSGGGLLHEYMVAAFAAELNLDVDEVEAALDAGQTMYDIAVANGVAAENVTAFMQGVHETALNNAVADGVITQEQADWMQLRMQGQGGAGGGRGMGRGGSGARGATPCGGTGIPVGTGLPQGGRWQQTNP